MKNTFYLLLLCIIGLSACTKTEYSPTAQGIADDAAIRAYLKANNLTATKDPSGVYYNVVTQGTGLNAVDTSTVQVNYVGKLLDGTVFAPAGKQSTTQVLSSFIPGWQVGIPYVRAGGRIILYIPSGYGYTDDTSNPSIPPNSVLIFTIDVLTVH